MSRQDRCTPLPADPLIDTAQAARIIGGHPNTLERDRATGRLGIPFVRIGRNIRYLLSDLTAWVRQNRVSTPRMKAAKGTKQHGRGK